MEHCDGCSMSTRDSYSSGHMVPSHLGLADKLIVVMGLFQTCHIFRSLCFDQSDVLFLL